MEYIGDSCFCGTAIGEITLPDTLETIEETAFDNCQNILVICLDGDSHLNINCIVKDHMVLLSRNALARGVPLWKFRQQKDVIIPDGIDTIEERWFMNS